MAHTRNCPLNINNVKKDYKVEIFALVLERKFNHCVHA
jgi:hypothetical protein